MRCARIKKKLPLLVGGELLDPTRTRVLEHTAECAECREELARYEEALGALRGAPAEWEKQTQWQGLWEAVRDATVMSEGRPAPVLLRLRLRTVLPVAVVVIIVAVAAVLMLYGRKPPAEHMPAPATVARQPNVIYVTDLLERRPASGSLRELDPWMTPSSGALADLALVAPSRPPVRYHLGQVRLVGAQEMEGF